ncbi:MAG TPA: glutamate 5-kinase [Nitrospirota bacterium]
MTPKRTTRKETVEKARRVVIKIGSTIVASRTAGVNQTRIRALSHEFALLRERGIEVIVVTSGAVAAGMVKLGLTERPRTIELKQASASVGQSALMRMYEKHLDKHGIPVGQVLLTSGDLTDRRRFLNARNTLHTLIELGAIPIINENDTVSIEELKFGDNDNLASLVTVLAGADMMVILSDVNGLYDKNPAEPGAHLVSEVPVITPEVEAMAGGSVSGIGTGGMASKLVAAKKATDGGAACFIINGTKAGNISKLFAGDEVGTFFRPVEESLSSKKHWIMYTMKPKGKLVVDEGAQKAVSSKGKSLLPSGIKSAEGKFAAGDAVEICALDGSVIARGLVNYSRAEVDKIKGVNSADIEKVLGEKYSDEVVHRDDLVIV